MVFKFFKTRPLIGELQCHYYFSLILVTAGILICTN
jgi:hypothetical protein